MNDKENFIASLEATLGKYKDKLVRVSQIAENYSTSEKENLLDRIENIKQKFKEAEKAYQNLKSASESNWEEVKESASDIFDALKESFKGIMEEGALGKLDEIKEEAIDYGQEKLNELSACIKKRPFTSACWAFGIGFILGKLFRTK